MSETETIPAPPALSPIPLPAEIEQAMPERRIVALDKIRASPTQQRKDFDAAKLAELAASIREHGVLQPPLARPRGKNGSAHFELVFGERRYRAAKLAGMREMPLLVRDLTDKEVVEIQIIENVQREGLEPLEEADGYRALHLEHGYDVATLAGKIGKSVGYIYARLKLCELGAPARKALSEGKITASSALLVARVPEALQSEAVKALLPPEKGLDPLGAREAFRVIQGAFMLRLANAPFDPKDAALVPAAGACATCPKRTGNQPELFADVSQKDTCTDPICFKTKRDAAWEQTKAKAKEEGREVLDGKAAKEIFPYQANTVAHNADYVDLDAQDYTDPKNRTHRERLGKRLQAAPVTLVRSPDGKVHEVLAKTELKKLLPKPKVERTSQPALAPSSPAERMKREAAKAGWRAALDQAVKKLETKELSTGMWRALVEREIFDDASGVDDVLIARGILNEGDGREETLKKQKAAFDKMNVGQLRALYVELRCAPEAIMWELNKDDLLPAFAREFGLDHKELTAKALARLKTEAVAPKVEAKPKAPTKKSSAKKGAKKK